MGEKTLEVAPAGSGERGDLLRVVPTSGGTRADVQPRAGQQEARLRGWPRDVGEEAAGPKGDKDLPRQEPPAGGCGRC